MKGVFGPLYKLTATKIARALGYTPQPVIEEIESSSVAVARVVRGTPSDEGTNTSTITIGELIGTVTSGGGTDATHIATGNDAAGYGGQIEAWLETDTNLIDAGLESFIDNGGGEFDLIYPLGANSDPLPTTDDPNLSFSEITAGADATGRFLLADKPLGYKVKENGFIYYLMDPDNYDSEAAWLVEPKIYAGFITQVGTDPPTFSIVTNTLGSTPETTYVAPGLYKDQFDADVLPDGRTSSYFGIAQDATNSTLVFSVARGNTDSRLMYSAWNGGVGEDGKLINNYFEIKVFPPAS
jgi:hypothetical protein